MRSAATRVAGAERAVTTQYDLAHALGECARPAVRAHSVVIHERVRDRFGFHEGLRNDAAVKIIGAIDAER